VGPPMRKIQDWPKL